MRRKQPRLAALAGFYVFSVLMMHSVYIQEDQENYIENIQNIRFGAFSKPRQVKPPSAEFVNLGMIVINLEPKERLEQKFLTAIERTFKRIFQFSSGTPLHFIIVTDKLSIGSVSLSLAEIISKDLASHAIMDTAWRWRRRKGLPPIQFSFVDIEDILDENRSFVEALKKQNVNGEDATKDKYAADLFYIGPLYHLAFSSIDKIIFIDSTDLLFVSDVKDLQDQFANIGDQAVMMVGLDLSPHYRINLEKFIKTAPETYLGKPGRYQGLNTGVVLFDLAKMRRSSQYNNNLSPERVHLLFSTYQMKMTVGDQDWFTLLSYQQENLFSILPCQFNAQTSLQYWSANKPTFYSYHHCDVPGSIKIYHCNGCGPKPESCGSPVARVAEYRDHINLLIQVIPVENLWLFLGHVYHSGKYRQELTI